METGILARALAYGIAHQAEVTAALGEHLLFVAIALGIGVVVCMEIGLKYTGLIEGQADVAVAAGFLREQGLLKRS